MYSKKNILHLITGLGVGGAERVVLDLVTHTDRNLFNVFVVSLSKRTEMLHIFEKNDIEITVLKKENTLIAFLHIIFFLNKFIKKNNIQIIHAHMTHSMIVAVMVKIFNPRVKIIFTSHSINFGSNIRKFLILLLKPFRSKDILFSEEQISSIYKKEFEIIPNGIKIEKYNLKIPKFEIFTYLAVGRLESMKNHIKLIECAKDLKEKNIDFQILIAGEGYERHNLEEKIRSNHLDDYIKLLGLRLDIAELMAKSHVLVMTSLWEGLPIVLLEAGAAGLSVISTPEGSIPSLLNDKNAYLSSLDDFCNKMEYVNKHYVEAVQKSLKLNEKIVQDYSIESIIDKHQSLYQETIGEKS